MGKKNTTDWAAVSDFFNGVLEATEVPILSSEELTLQVHVYSPAFDETLLVEIPPYLVSKFLQNLPFYQADVQKGMK